MEVGGGKQNFQKELLALSLSISKDEFSFPLGEVTGHS